MGDTALGARTKLRKAWSQTFSRFGTAPMECRRPMATSTVWFGKCFESPFLPIITLRFRADVARPGLLQRNGVRLSTGQVCALQAGFR